jgi:hypothetical protein
VNYAICRDQREPCEDHRGSGVQWQDHHLEGALGLEEYLGLAVAVGTRHRQAQARVPMNPAAGSTLADEDAVTFLPPSHDPRTRRSLHWATSPVR